MTLSDKTIQQIKNILWTILGIEALLFLLTSCEYEDLCYNHNHDAKAEVKVPVDWRHFDEEIPTGMTVLAYPDDEDKPMQVLTNYTKEAELSLEEGSYHIMVFNQSESEYGSLVFEGMDKYSTARVLAKNYQSRWYNARSDGEKTATTPEWLADGSLDNVRITQNMVTADSTFTTDTVKPRNVVFTINVNVHVKNIYNVRSARASLTGLAAGFYFGSNKATTETITQLLENWTLTPDKDNPANGTLSASIMSFGLPSDHDDKKASENILTLSLLLVDNKTQEDYTFEVGGKFTNENGTSEKIDLSQTTDVDLDLDLDLKLEVESAIKDVPPAEGSAGGFDATVEDWGDEIKIDIDA